MNKINKNTEVINSNPVIIGYLRVSTEDQVFGSQEEIILKKANEKQLFINRWIKIKISSSKSTELRKLDSIIEELQKGDIIFVSELTRLGRSTSELLNTVKNITDKDIRLIICNENLDLQKSNVGDVPNHVTLIIFSLLADIEKKLIKQRTKEALSALKAKNIILGKPIGTIQKSVFDNYKDEILKCLRKKMTNPSIIKWIEFGTVRNLNTFIKTRKLREFIAQESK